MLERSPRRGIPSVVAVLLTVSIVAMPGGLALILISFAPAVDPGITWVSDVPSMLMPGGVPEDGQPPRSLLDNAPEDTATYGCRLERNLNPVVGWQQRAFFEVHPDFVVADKDTAVLKLSGKDTSYDGRLVELTVTFHRQTCQFEVIHQFGDVRAAPHRLPYVLMYVSQTEDGTPVGEVHRSDNSGGCLGSTPPGYNGEFNGQQIFMVFCTQLRSL